MAKRIKKPPVKPERRLDWLRRHEEYGETPPQIAEADGFDVRTVRNHLDRARQERDQKTARISLVKEALEKHHQDMISLVEELLSQVTGNRSVTLDYSENLYLDAMRKHLPRESIWTDLKRWNDAFNNMDKITSDARNRITSSLRKSKINDIYSEGAQGVVMAAIDVLLHQFTQWAQGGRGLNIEDDLVIEDRRDGEISLRYGFAHFGWIKEEDLDTVTKVIISFEKRIRKWSEYQEMKEQHEKLLNLQANIRTELKGIIMRRILPGKCNYCPI